MVKLRLRTNLRCAACIEEIRPLLDAVPSLVRWEADVSTDDKVLTAEGEGITARMIDELIQQKGYRVLGEMPLEGTMASPSVEPVKTSYFPLVLILCYLLGGCALLEVALSPADGMRAMRHFMAGFFLVFSFFKLLDLPSFADSYRGYDVVAKRFPVYGYLYPIIELALGIAYLGNFGPLYTNLMTLIVMGVSTIGVVQSLVQKKKVRCACLGAVFNLPMSYVTLTEDLLMVVMAAAMVVMLMS